MKILIYKRTHIGDPDGKRQFGNEGCMGRIRGFAFDAVIGVGGISGLPTRQCIARKINWVGRHPRKSVNPEDSRGPLVSFRTKDFRLFEHQGPLLSIESPLLAKKVFGSRARFFFLSLSPAERKEAQRLLHRILDLGVFDHLQLSNSPFRLEWRMPSAIAQRKVCEVSQPCDTQPCGQPGLPEKPRRPVSLNVRHPTALKMQKRFETEQFVDVEQGLNLVMNGKEPFKIQPLQ